MKTLEEILKKIPQEQLKEMASVLSIKSYNENKLKTTLNNIFSINKILSRFNPEELTILKLIYSDNDGISFGEIQKKTGMDIQKIENIINVLSGNLLVYITKNRQLLNKKMDKVYCIEEIAGIFTISSSADIKDYLQNAQDEMINTLAGDSPLSKIKDQKSIELIKEIFLKGGVTTIRELAENSQDGDYEKTIANLIEKNILKFFFVLSDTVNTFIAVYEEIMPHAASLFSEISEPDEISNSFNTVINLLHAYDSVSSFGLFLTKQGKFRKIDIKKISDRMLNIKNYKGELIDREEIAQFSLQLMNILECLKIDRDIGVVSLKKIADKLDDPVQILKALFNRIIAGHKPADIFTSAVAIPDASDIKTILSIFQKVKKGDCRYFKLLFTMSERINNLKKYEKIESDDSEKENHRFKSLIEFMLITGAAGIDQGNLYLTEEGKWLQAALGNKKYSRDVEASRCVYINPDFTLMIPDKEIDPVSLYYLLAYTDIIKNDVITEVAITKNSIVNANKRGMYIERFISTLNKYAKNGIPQNLEFLLKEWTNQTIRIEISRSILIHSSHSTLLDEISYSSISGLIIKRISENYAIIARDSIDEIIKFSRKFDAVINIFENQD